MAFFGGCIDSTQLKTVLKKLLEGDFLIELRHALNIEDVNLPIKIDANIFGSPASCIPNKNKTSLIRVEFLVEPLTKESERLFGRIFDQHLVDIASELFLKFIIAHEFYHVKQFMKLGYSIEDYFSISDYSKRPEEHEANGFAIGYLLKGADDFTKEIINCITNQHFDNDSASVFCNKYKGYCVNTQ